jgi:hypothetical protein
MAIPRVFKIDKDSKKLAILPELTLAAIGAKETADLETWLESAGDTALGRRILWIARQDQATHQDRSDLVGVDDGGSLVVAELKVVEVDESAITQALVCAATYRNYDQAQLAELWSRQSEKGSRASLTRTAGSVEDARKPEKTSLLHRTAYPAYVAWTSLRASSTAAVSKSKPYPRARGAQLRHARSIGRLACTALPL